MFGTAPTIPSVMTESDVDRVELNAGRDGTTTRVASLVLRLRSLNSGGEGGAVLLSGLRTALTAPVNVVGDDIRAEPVLSIGL
jgi:hypothetical protein